MVPGDNTIAVPLDNVADAANEPRALCIIRDVTSSQWQSSKYTLNLPSTTTGQKILEEVSRRCRYDVRSFELILQKIPDGDCFLINEHPNHTLQDMGFRCGGNKRNNLIIGDVNGIQPKRIEEDGNEEGATFIDDMPVEMFRRESIPSRNKIDHEPSSPPDDGQRTERRLDSFSKHSSGDFGVGNSCQLIKPGLEFVGLVNQAMTCYLNSLLQTLYMTPEFRNALYRWEFDGSEEEKCKSIPYQLQRLFLNLQVSKRHSVETTELTKSFGWDSSEAWQQHDVQELCRVMFDALEQKFKNTDQADLINRLYQGKIRDYVKCLACGNESAREDSYLDIPLPVRPFGATNAFESVEEALQAFVQPEVLNGSNQYFCEKCDKKCDAHKGLKFSTFSYILTLQLKRFDFDYTTLHRIKLNDKVTFPEILNLNALMKGEKDDLQVANDTLNVTNNSSVFNEENSNSANDNMQVNNLSTSNSLNHHGDEGVELKTSTDSLNNSEEVSANERNWRNSLSHEQGQYLYELFSIMVHSGSANGGHYYAYIKSFKDGQWYCFNDQNVSKITYDDICKTYGGGPSRTYYSGAYSCSTNAYMLFYRQINKEWNAEAMSEEEFPPHIKDVLSKLDQQEELERQRREVEKSMYKIKLFWNSSVLRRLSDTILKVHKDITLKEATKTAHTILGLEGLVPLERCRLVKYDDNLDSLECSYEECNEMTIGNIVGSPPKANLRFSFLLEVWPVGKVVPVYKPGGATVKVYPINLDTEDVEAPYTIRSCLNQTIEEFKNQIVQELQLVNKSPQIVLERYYSDLRILNDPIKTLKCEGFYRSNKVFVEKSEKLDGDDGSRKHIFQKILDRYENTICLNITLPDITNEYLSKHVVPLSLENDLPKNGETLLSRTDLEFENKDIEHTNSLGVNNGDLSEDSSLTDSDRTVIGDLSLHTDISGASQILASLESDLRNKSNGSSCNSSISPQDGDDRDGDISLSSDENAKDTNGEKESSYAWDQPFEEVEIKEDLKRYFKAVQFVDPTSNSKMLRVHLDKRTTLMALKKELEHYVGVVSDSFKIFRIYSNNQEFECTRLSETLVPYNDDTQMVVKVGRALKKGEFRVKIYQLQINEHEPAVFLIDWILTKGQTVLHLKKELLPEIKTKCNLDIQPCRCRLRKKHWKTPATVFIDSQKFDGDISIFDNFEIYLEILNEPEKLTTSTQLSVYTRWWHPAVFVLDPIKEVVLNNDTVEQLLLKISEISSIPPEFIDFAKIQGTFSGEVSLLTLHSDLDWNPQVTTLNMRPLYICDDGFVICFKDRREILKQLGDNERREIITRENARLQKSNYCGHSPRKERALKIYTDCSPTKSKAITESELD